MKPEAKNTIRNAPVPSPENFIRQTLERLARVRASGLRAAPDYSDWATWEFTAKKVLEKCGSSLP